MTRLTRRGFAACALAFGLTVGAATAHAADVELRFYYPIAVGGPITKIIDEYAAAFEKEHPGIKVKPIYAGDYTQTIGKALTAMKGGDTPELAILLAADLMTLIDEDAVVAFDDVIKTPAEKAWLDSFYPAFMENARLKGKTYAIPFQRSTPVLYWNKDMFKAAGLDPERGPKDWAEMRDFAKKLTKKDASGKVTQWGIEIPSDGNSLWLFTGLTTGNGVRINNAEGTKVNVADPKVIEALQYWYDLSKVDGSQPAGLINWGTTPRDFLEGRTAMIWHTTGNLTNVRSNAKFPFGVAFLPGKTQFGAPTGGGNFYLFKGLSPEKQQAALTFVKWMTTPERAAEWSIKTGYVATQPAAYETPAMKAYTADFQAAIVARDQLKYAVPELTVHDNQRVTKILNDGLQAAMTGTKTPEAAMKDAQREADRILKNYE
jgi:sn-glycerol 3-phosphate transport system substrate-binding protein